MILTDDEIDAAWPAPPGTNSMLTYARVIEAAILAKLRAGVEVPEPKIWASERCGQTVFTRDQLLQYGDARALAAVEQDKADAERYRWLRESDSEHARVMTYIEGLDEWLAYSTAEDIDAAVDQKRGEA